MVFHAARSLFMMEVKSPVEIIWDGWVAADEETDVESVLFEGWRRHFSCGEGRANDEDDNGVGRGPDLLGHHSGLYSG